MKTPTDTQKTNVMYSICCAEFCVQLRTTTKRLQHFDVSAMKTDELCASIRQKGAPHHTVGSMTDGLKKANMFEPLG